MLLQAQKISRYNGIVVALSNILLWWDSMSAVDKASPVNIDLLVQMGEATLNAVCLCLCLCLGLCLAS